jgi:hypothetical protein
MIIIYSILLSGCRTKDYVLPTGEREDADFDNQTMTIVGGTLNGNIMQKNNIL